MSKKIAVSDTVAQAARSIRLLVLDVDGVMTDGAITYTSAGDESKSFNVKDGAGIKYWHRAGHTAGIITGRSSPIVVRRAEELGIQMVEMDAKNKLPVFLRLLEAAGVAAAETAVIGDDLPDLPLIRRAGLGIAVADAVPAVREAAHLVTNTPGGRGAVRECIDLILTVQNRWDGLMERYR
ncbi:MAG: HAD hydrolase family protein [Planctomycetes bacterium]|nr:HAD hydrolase family protein [Planctomycetota bacterium]